MPHDDWDPDALAARITRYAPYLGAGVRVSHIAPDASEVRVEMPLTESNVNLVGTHFGGSLYSMVDPHLMVLLMQRLGSEYIVWDKSAFIDFLRPGRGTVRATIRVTEADIERIREATADGSKHLPEWTISILDEEGHVVATVVKTLYVRRRRKQ